MILSFKKFITAAVIGTVSLSSLTACVISDDPYVNTAATAATTAGVVSLLLYSIHDGYYYDENYRQMPRNYRPPHNVRVVRVNNIHEYRKAHPRPVVQHTPQQHTQRPNYHRGNELKRQNEMRKNEMRRNEQQLKRQEQTLRRNEQQIKRQNEIRRQNEQQIRKNERQIRRQEQRKHENNRQPQRRKSKYDN